MSEVIQMKLVSGDSVVASLVERDTEKNIVKIVRPFKIHTVSDDDGQISYLLTPWGELFDPETIFPLHESDMITMGLVGEQGKLLYYMRLKDMFDVEDSHATEIDLTSWNPDSEIPH